MLSTLYLIFTKTGFFLAFEFFNQKWEWHFITEDLNNLKNTIFDN